MKQMKKPKQCITLLYIFLILIFIFVDNIYITFTTLTYNTYNTMKYMQERNYIMAPGTDKTL